MADKPEVLQDSRFTVEEGLAYRATRTGAIWMNKLFFSSLVLLGVWLLWAFVAGTEGCVAGVPQAPAGFVADCPQDQIGSCNPDARETGTQCNPFLTPTSAYLAAMAMLTFVLSLLFGLAGLVVGKRIVERTPAAAEVGARREEPPAPPQA